MQCCQKGPSELLFHRRELREQSPRTSHLILLVADTLAVVVSLDAVLLFPLHHLHSLTLFILSPSSFARDLHWIKALKRSFGHNPSILPLHMAPNPPPIYQTYLQEIKLRRQDPPTALLTCPISSVRGGPCSSTNTGQRLLTTPTTYINHFITSIFLNCHHLRAIPQYLDSRQLLQLIAQQHRRNTTSDTVAKQEAISKSAHPYPRSISKLSCVLVPSFPSTLPYYLHIHFFCTSKFISRQRAASCCSKLLEFCRAALSNTPKRVNPTFACLPLIWPSDQVPSELHSLVAVQKVAVSDQQIILVPSVRSP